MTKEESIALAEKLQKCYANLDGLKEQIDRNEKQMKSRSSTTIKGHTYIRYFWPWLVAALVAFFLVGFIHNSAFRYSVNSVQYTFMALRYIIPIIVIIVGVIVAGFKKESDSRQVEFAQRSAAETITKLRTANEDNRKKIERIELELEEYRSLIPAKARSKTAMFKVVSMLKTGKAENLEDAISKL